jgi:hypothetical protein
VPALIKPVRKLLSALLAAITILQLPVSEKPDLAAADITCFLAEQTAKQTHTSHLLPTQIQLHFPRNKDLLINNCEILSNYSRSFIPEQLLLNSSQLVHHACLSSDNTAQNTLI